MCSQFVTKYACQLQDFGYGNVHVDKCVPLERVLYMVVYVDIGTQLSRGTLHAQCLRDFRVPLGMIMDNGTPCPRKFFHWVGTGHYKDWVK